MIRSLFTLTAVLALFAAFSPRSLAVEVDLTPKPVERIPAGTRFGDEPPQGYSNIISFVEGRLASGDVDAVSDTVNYYAKIFNLVMLGNSKQDESGGYVLDKVAVGFSMVIDGKNVVVTSESQKRLNSGLSMIGAGVLSGNEAALADFMQVARTNTSMIIDAPTIMLRNNEHRPMICRYAIWAKPSGEGIGTAVWLLDDVNSGRGDYQVVEKTFQFLPANMHEDRVMNIKKDRFTFGLPAKDAFALVRIPQGTAYPITPQMQSCIGAHPMNKEKYVQIWASMSQAMK